MFGTTRRTTLVAGLAGALLLAAASRPAHAAPLCGDFNGDKGLSASDALGVLRTAVGQQECQRAVCDYSGDGDITATDALAVLRKAVGSLGREPMCPPAGCNGPDCAPTCPDGSVDCCDDTTCSGNGKCSVDDGLAWCDCDEGWTGAACNAPADLYPFAEKPTSKPPAWVAVDDVLVRPASYGEQMRHDLPPGTFFVANASLRADVEAGKTVTNAPFVFPDGDVDRFPLEKKNRYTSPVRVVERRDVGGTAKIETRFPKVTVYRSLYETDGSVKSVLDVLAVEDGGFVARGLARHESNLPGSAGVFGVTVAPVGGAMRLDDIAPEEGEVDDSTLLMTTVFFANAAQAGLFEECDGLEICTELCADMGVDTGDPGPACPAPPEPCEHVSPCGDGHDPGDPADTNQCNDGDDNDGDGESDAFEDAQCDHFPTCEPGGDIPEHVHRYEAGADFGLFGDVTWCTKQGDNWPSQILARGYHTETPFHKNTGWFPYDSLYRWGGNAYDPDEKLVRLGIVGCWRLDTEEEAAACADDVSQCGPFAAGPHKYPYRYGRDAEGMWDGLRVDVWHARGIGMNQPLHAAQAITSALVGASEADHIPGWASVVGTNVSGLDTSPHELGHSLGLTHCEARLVNGLWTLMGNSLQVQGCPPGQDYGNHQQARFSDASGEKLHNCFLGDCMASPGFGAATPP